MISKPAAALCSLLLMSSPLGADGPEAAGDRAYGERAAGFADRGIVSLEPIESAIAAYEEALAREPDNLRLHVKLMDALYFKAYFIIEEKAGSRKLYERLGELATRAFDLAVERAGGKEGFAGRFLEEQVERLRHVSRRRPRCASGWRPPGGCGG